jgi:hypothetical protein
MLTETVLPNFKLIQPGEQSDTGPGISRDFSFMKSWTRSLSRHGGKSSLGSKATQVPASAGIFHL